MQATIFDIQRFSVYDGPGARTAVFFKGCNLRCRWCHNPESIATQPALEYTPERCIGCGRCIVACPERAHAIDGEGRHVLDRDRCVACLACVDTCFAEALTGVGQAMTPEELVAAVLSDAPYYARSGGGVTLTGGECLLQPEFVREVLTQLKAEDVHTAVDTAGNVPWEWIEPLLPLIDLFLYDLKAVEPAVHEAWTGVSNERILDNLHRLIEQECRVWVRVPLIPGCNDAEMPAIARFLAPFAVERVEIMPYHKLAQGKYAALGMEHTGPICAIPTDSEIAATLRLFTNNRLPAYAS